MIALGGVTVMFLAGVPLRLFVGGALAAAIAAPLAFNFLLHDYQRNRVLIFMDPESDPLGTGYHISQSKIAIGSGGILGKGFLNGTQSHLDYLPEGHTDFVFATMAEEWGLVGGFFMIVAFLLLIRWGVSVGAARQEPLLAPGRGRARDDDLLLHRDQPDDGDGPGAGGRHPAAAGQLGRDRADDGTALPRHPDVDRPPEPPNQPLVSAYRSRVAIPGSAANRPLPHAAPRRLAVTGMDA